TSITVQWTQGTNPSSVTPYVVNLSTASGFNGANDLSSTTFNLNATFTGLVPETTYYAEVKAVNFSGISTVYLNVGSTVTQSANAPTNLVYTGAISTSLRPQWTAHYPAGQSYILQVSPYACDF